jgi:hypothetical protein
LSENERLRLEHSEKHLQNRQTVYHNLLNAERRLLTVINASPVGQPDVFAAFTSLTEVLHGAVLFGTKDVAEEAVEYQATEGAFILPGNPWTGPQWEWPALLASRRSSLV